MTMKQTPKELAERRVKSARRQVELIKDSPKVFYGSEGKKALEEAEADLRKAEAAVKAGPLPKPTPSVKPLPTTPTVPVVAAKSLVTPPVKQPFPPLREGATGLERAAWANAKQQHEKN